MGKWEFYDDFDEVEGDDQEPSFSLYDFKKWLDKNPGNLASFSESVEQKKQENSAIDKDALKEEFKQRIKDKVQRNIDKKIAERKKKRN